MNLDQIRVLPKSAIARKYNCSVQYVRKILIGESPLNSERSQKVYRDSVDILSVLERDTFSTE